LTSPQHLNRLRRRNRLHRLATQNTLKPAPGPNLLFCSAFVQRVYSNVLGNAGDFKPGIRDEDTSPGRPLVSRSRRSAPRKHHEGPLREQGAQNPAATRRSGSANHISGSSRAASARGWRAATRIGIFGSGYCWRQRGTDRADPVATRFRPRPFQEPPRLRKTRWHAFVVDRRGQRCLSRRSSVPREPSFPREEVHGRSTVERQSGPGRGVPG
jgi:hypothetical protein